MRTKQNIAITGGSCTGKSTLAAALFAKLKISGFDYELINEENRRLKGEFGDFRSPFERFYMWRQQEREELRSSAADGFVTDAPLIHFYLQARLWAAEPRDQLAIRELFRMCLEITDRYHLFVLAENPDEIAYATDEVRHGNPEKRRRSHALARSFIEHFWPEKLLTVSGPVEARVEQVLKRLCTQEENQ